MLGFPRLCERLQKGEVNHTQIEFGEATLWVK